jgi:uncharacterized membrane protein
MPLSPPAAIAISIGSIVAGWIVYDGCAAAEGQGHAARGDHLRAGDGERMGVLPGVQRARRLHTRRRDPRHDHGANVFFQIIPGQKRLVADIRAGRPPDPTPGIIGKQRSVHNTYFTLPVLFIMISNHYPMTYSHPHGWLVLGGLMMAGVLIRQYFVLRHRHAANPLLLVIAGALLVALIVWLSPSASVNKGAAANYSAVRKILDERCISCHAAQPKQAGFPQPPKGVMVETAEQVTQHAAKIAETVANRYMPIANLTQMTDDERATIAQWFAAGAKVN